LIFLPVLACDNIGDIMTRMRLAARVCHDADALMAVAFEGIGSLPMSKIRRVRDVHLAALVAETREVNRRRKNSGIARKSWMLDVGAGD
jgi:hypothetical protein